MKRAKQSRSNFVGIILAVVVLMIGVVITLAIPVIGCSARY